jgi:CheY-like chemotaxis protein
MRMPRTGQPPSKPKLWSRWAGGKVLLSGFRLLERSPVLGGSLLGVLTIKPQFWLMTPVALIAGGEWRALLSAGITALALLVASAAVFGLDTWQSWFLTAVIPPSDVYQSWLEWGRMAGQSVYTGARVLGASDGLANAAQAIAALLAGSCVFWVFRCPFPMSGFDATQILKAEDLTRTIPIVITSAYGADVDKEVLRECGCDRYIPAPIQISSFVDVIHSLMEPG